MPSYSDWISTKRSVYTLAMTRAYNARNEDPNSNELASAWASLSQDSSTQPLLPPATNFFGETPTATESDIEALETFLNSNISVAGKLNLRTTILADNDITRKGLGGKGTVGAEKRRWKGQPLYTFANGILVGKDSKLVAAIGTEGGEDIVGFGDDTLIYFDGIAGSKGSGIPGTTVFKGDVVVSGSIQGSGGVVIIDDVIQLEQGVDNPAGIGVDPSGKIRLRDRGQGFLNLIDESERIAEEEANKSLIEAKVWMGHQNTSSARWGSSLIPNSNFSMLTSIEQSGVYSEKISGVITVGSSTSVQIAEDPHDGILRFDASNGVGVALPAVQITGSKYFIRVRYKGTIADPIDTVDTSEGLFLEFHESIEEDIGDKSHVYDAVGAYPGPLTESSSWYQADSRKSLNSLTTPDGAAIDGLAIPSTYSTDSYVYEPTSGTKTASLVIRTRDYSGTIHVDYVVMTEGVPTPQEVAALVEVADQEIELEDTSSLVVGSQMTDHTQFQSIGGAVLEDVSDGGDNHSSSSPDAAVKVTIGSGGQGVLTKAISEGADRFLVGVRIKATSGTPNLSITAIETTLPQVPGLGSDPEFIVPGSGNTRQVSIQLAEIDDTTKLEKTGGTITLDSTYTTYLGTYDKTIINPDGTVADFDGTTLEDNIHTPYLFSLAITADAACELLIDYIYCKEQTVSLNIAQSLADAAVGDSATFVTTINNLLVKESGSLITNASMALPGLNDLPAGYRTKTGCTLELITSEDATGTITDRAISVSASGGTRTLISPPFSLGSADRYSIGVSVKSNTGSGNVQLKVAYIADSIASDKITISDSASTTDVQTSGVSVDNTFEIANESGDVGTSVSVTGNFENLIGTWQEPAGQRFGSIIIECDSDFTVDYILAKAQSCSFDLAKETAEEKRDEAIAMATGALNGLTNALNQEQGSLLGNPTFSHWLYEDSTNPISGVTGYQSPKAWAVTRSSSCTLARVVGVTESVDDADGNAIPVPGEHVDSSLGVLGGGAIFSHGGSARGGILSSYFTIPSVPGLNDQTVGDDTYSPNGSYIVSIKLKSISGLNHVSGVRILAHEMVESPSSQFSICTSSTESDYNTTTLESSYSSIFTGDSFTEDGTSYFTQKIQLINATDTSDVTVGTGSDEYLEQWNDSSFHIIAGSYTPSANVRYVCFEFIFETNVATQKYVLDYVSMMPQSIDGNFADTIASARAEGAIELIEEEPPQVGNLIANPFFASAIKSSRSTRPKKWVPYGYQVTNSHLTFANNSIKRGAKLDSIVSASVGIISKPFRTSADDYEITIRAKRISSNDTNCGIQVLVVEHDTDIEEDDSSTIDAIVPGSYHPSGYNTIVGSEGQRALTSSTGSQTVALTTSYQTIRFEYIPSETSRFASIYVRANSADTGQSAGSRGIILGSVKCVVDNAATGTRLFGAFRGKALSDLDVGSFADVGNKLLTTTLRNNILTNNSKVGWAGQVTQYTNSDATAAAAGMNLIDFSNFGSDLNTVNLQHAPMRNRLLCSGKPSYINYAFNGDWKLRIPDGWGSGYTVPAGVLFANGKGDNNYGWSSHSDQYPIWYEDDDGDYVHIKGPFQQIVFPAMEMEGGTRIKFSFDYKATSTEDFIIDGRYMSQYSIGSGGSVDGKLVQDTSVQTNRYWRAPWNLLCQVHVGLHYVESSGEKKFVVFDSTKDHRDENKVNVNSSLTESCDGRKSTQVTIGVEDEGTSAWATKTVTIDVPAEATYGSVFVCLGPPTGWYNGLKILQNAESPNASGDGTGGRWTSSYIYSGPDIYQNQAIASNGSSNPLYHRVYTSAANARNDTGTREYSRYYDINEDIIVYNLYDDFDASSTPTTFARLSLTAVDQSWSLSENSDHGLYIRDFTATRVAAINLNAVSAFANGTVTLSSFAGFTGVYSDERLKENKQPLKGAIEKVTKINPISFEWIPQNGKERKAQNEKKAQNDNLTQYGFSAQDVQKVFPELVGSYSKKGRDLLKLNQPALIPWLFAAVKEQQEQIEDLKALVNKLIKDKESEEEDPT